MRAEPAKTDGPRLGLTASFTPRFSTKPVADFMDGVLGNDATCVSGFAFDAGLAWGNPRGSFLRVAFNYKAIADGSFVRRSCEECDAFEIVTAGSLGAVRQYGIQGEIVYRLPVGKSRKVQPMVSLHGGVGTWSGQATSAIFRPTSATSDIVPAGKMFNTPAYGGVGIGVVGGNERWTIGATAVGIEVPTGLYGGRIQLTRWF